MGVDEDIIKLGRQKSFDKLAELLENNTTDNLSKMIIDRIGKSDALTLWNYILLGFSTTDTLTDNCFTVTKNVLNYFNEVELSSRQLFDFICRLFVDLPKFKANHLIELIEYCLDGIRAGDPKCTGWKDLFPQLIILINSMTTVRVNGITLTGPECRQQYIQNICTMKWTNTVLTPIASMFKEIPITKDDKVTIVKKLCHQLQDLTPLELPVLAYQLFSLCSNNATLLVTPIMSIDHYLYRNHYKKAFYDLDSELDMNSIDLYSESDLRQAEDTILFHLSNCTEYSITEKEMVAVFRQISSLPQYILTPFIISGLLTMCTINRYPDSTNLSSSSMLPFLRNVIRNNEQERAMSMKSIWCRDSLKTDKPVSMDQIFTILVDQSKIGTDVVTGGIINLAFILLKSNNNLELNTLGTDFLKNFIKKRYIFGQGIIKKLIEFLLVDLDALQFSDCLSRLSLSSTLTVSECVQSVENVIKYLLVIPGEHAMRIMAFIVPLASISMGIRDSFIEVLRKAMNQRESKTRQMGVYGFCTLLKQLRNNNSQRRQTNCGILTYQSISGFSLMSQATLANATSSSRFLDCLVLEIVGLFQKCFNQSYDIKDMLYTELYKAVVINPKITTHILQFTDQRFRSFFDVGEEKFDFKYDLLLRHNTVELVEMKEPLGKLINLIGRSIIVCNDHDSDFELTTFEKFMKTLIENIPLIPVEQSDLMHQSLTLIPEYLNCLEALMAYLLLKQRDNDHQNLTNILKLFKRHVECSDWLKSTTNKLRSAKKIKKSDKTNNQVNSNCGNVSAVASTLKSSAFKSVNIWNLYILERFLNAIYINLSSRTDCFRANRNFMNYINVITNERISGLKMLPDYQQVHYSRATFQTLCNISDIVYKKCMCKVEGLWKNDGDIESVQLIVECFTQCLITADRLYKRKFVEFLKSVVTEESTDQSYLAMVVIKYLHNLIEKSIFSKEIDYNQTVFKSSKLPSNLLKCLDILYDYVSAENELQMAQCYDWLYRICSDKDIQPNADLINKLLFKQRIKCKAGLFFNFIAGQISHLLGQIDEQEVIKNPSSLKSITLETIDSALIHLCVTIKEQIENIEYFITKAKGFNVAIEMRDNDEHCLSSLKTIERNICSELIHVGTTLTCLANTCIPLGQCMDSLVRLLIQFYVCLSNLAKHFILRRSESLSVAYRNAKFDQLIRISGKPLATKVYGLITYIEGNIFEPNEKKRDASADKAKVVKETKLIPKIILRIESLNKFIICLCKKSKSDDLTHFLHIGTVRDFRIKTDQLRDVINQTIHESQIDDIDEERMDEVEVERVDDAPADLPINDDSSTQSSTSTVASETIINDNNVDLGNAKQALKNLTKINEKAKRRKAVTSDESSSSRPPKKARKKNN